MKVGFGQRISFDKDKYAMNIGRPLREVGK